MHIQDQNLQAVLYYSSSNNFKNISIQTSTMMLLYFVHELSDITGERGI